MITQGRLSGKVAIVTGAGGGFGAGIVNKFCTEGAQVLAVDINESAITKVSKEWPTMSFRCIVADVASEDGWRRVLEDVLNSFGHLDVVVNNAGVISMSGPSINILEEDYDRIMRVNLKSLYFSTKAIIPYFRDNHRPGLFINISSISAARPRPGLVWYSASKAAVTTATKGLAVEWAPHGIRFNAIQPVVGETAMLNSVLGGDESPEARGKLLQGIPLGKACTPEDIANTAAWLASDEATMLTGAAIDVDGGRGV